MNKIKLSKEYMLKDVLSNRDVIVRDTITGKRRWSDEHELIFRHEGGLYRAHYRRGSTEYQDERPWEHEDDVECVEVEAYEKTVTDYREKP